MNSKDQASFAKERKRAEREFAEQGIKVPRRTGRGSTELGILCRHAQSEATRLKHQEATLCTELNNRDRMRHRTLAAMDDPRNAYGQAGLTDRLANLDSDVRCTVNALKRVRKDREQWLAMVGQIEEARTQWAQPSLLG